MGIHGIFSAFFVGIGFLIGNPWYGFVASIAFFWAREHAQKQDNIADSSGRKVKELKWYEGADMTQWSRDSFLDFFVPLMVSLILCLGLTYLF